MATPEQATKMVEQAALVSQKIREALQASLPVAPEQLMTIQIPGTIIDTSPTGPYYWNDAEEADTPHRIKTNEARLVDGMIPLSKIMMGPTGKSVARSYAGALDMLIPEDAPIDTDKSTTTKTAAAERYTAAMKYLTGPATSGGNASVIDIYVEKQQAYSDAMSAWDQAKQLVREEARKLYPHEIRKQQTHYDAWNQENFRNFKNHAQAKYMDWIVNGNKYKVDYYFGIVDVSSAMKRVESSKEAARNLVVIDPDGSTEWQEVRLTPANWARLCKEKVDSWRSKNGQLTMKDYETELKRLNRLLLSYTGLKLSIDPHGSVEKLPASTPAALPAGDTTANGTKQNSTENGTNPSLDSVGDKAEEPGKKTAPIANGTGNTTGDSSETHLSKEDQELADAYKNLYLAQAEGGDSKELSNIRAKQGALQEALVKSSGENLKENKKIAADLANLSKVQKINWINNMITDTKSQIRALQDKLNEHAKASVQAPAITEIVISQVNEQGSSNPKELVATKYSDADDKWADPRFQIARNGVAVPLPNPDEQPNKWTKITLSISASSEEDKKSSQSSSSSLSASGSSGLFSASVGMNYSQASSQASNSAASCNVDIKFEALLVTIDRAWLHGELFNDPELNTGQDVHISPGALALHRYIDLKDEKALAAYPYFPSYPTSFIVASGIELEFRGDTTHLESAVESSHFDAQVKVGYGPFSLSASHSQDKSSAKTKMETTATGTRITLEAPAIIGWVSQLVPQLPRPKGGNTLVGPLF